MRKKICIALMAAFTVLLGVSGYFIIDHYREAEHQEQMYDSLVQLVEDSETEPAEPIIYSEDKTILPELTELYRQNNDLVGWICVEDIAVYEEIKSQADKVVYTSHDYFRGCMFKRNRHLVNGSSVCIAYLTQEKGGTAYTVNYARQNNVQVINLAAQ
mgnify:CR=1 FL=1